MRRGIFGGYHADEIMIIEGQIVLTIRPSTILDRIARARSKGLRIALSMTGGRHTTVLWKRADGDQIAGDYQGA